MPDVSHLTSQTRRGSKCLYLWKYELVSWVQDCQKKEAGGHGYTSECSCTQWSMYLIWHGSNFRRWHRLIPFLMLAGFPKKVELVIQLKVMVKSLIPPPPQLPSRKSNDIIFWEIHKVHYSVLQFILQSYISKNFQKVPFLWVLVQLASEQVTHLSRLLHSVWHVTSEMHEATSAWQDDSRPLLRLLNLPVVQQLFKVQSMKFCDSYIIITRVSNQSLACNRSLSHSPWCVKQKFIKSQGNTSIDQEVW